MRDIVVDVIVNDWFDTELARDVRIVLASYNENRGEYFATTIALFTYDKLTGDNVTNELYADHHRFLAITLNSIFYSENHSRMKN